MIGQINTRGSSLLMKAKSNVSDPDSGELVDLVDVQLNEHETLDLGFDLEPEIVSEIEKETDTDIDRLIADMDMEEEIENDLPKGEMLNHGNELAMSKFHEMKTAQVVKLQGVNVNFIPKDIAQRVKQVIQAKGTDRKPKYVIILKSKAEVGATEQKPHNELRDNKWLFEQEHLVHKNFRKNIAIKQMPSKYAQRISKIKQANAAIAANMYMIGGDTLTVVNRHHVPK